jgi:hypothetical protein
MFAALVFGPPDGRIIGPRCRRKAGEEIRIPAGEIEPCQPTWAGEGDQFADREVSSNKSALSFDRAGGLIC